MGATGSQGLQGSQKPQVEVLQARKEALGQQVQVEDPSSEEYLI